MFTTGATPSLATGIDQIPLSSSSSLSGLEIIARFTFPARRSAIPSPVPIPETSIFTPGLSSMKSEAISLISGYRA